MKELRYCPWCGSTAEVRRRVYPSTEDRAWVKCCDKFFSKCFSHSAMTRTPELAIEAWNNGNIYLPMSVCLPQVHHIVERTILDRVYHLKPNRFTVIVPNGRIDRVSHLMKLLNPCIEYGQPQPFLFTLYESYTIHRQTKLISFELFKTGNHGSFTFQSNDSEMLVGSDVMTDKVWTERYTPPPIIENVFKTLQKE